MAVLGFDSNKLFSDDRSTDIIRALFPFLLMVIGGIVFIFFYTLQFFLHSWIVAWSVLGVATIVAGASLLFGGLLGFLFGIPRTVEETRKQNKEQNNPENSESDDGGNPIQANTNLEDISDWLTKILVGVGLTQIEDIVQAIARLIDWLAPGFSDGTPEKLMISKGFTLAVFVYFNVSGFFIGFLWARLYLPSQFKQADTDVRKKVNKIDSQVQDAKKQTKIDAEAIILASQQLNSKSLEVKGEERENLIEKIANASKLIRVRTFLDAQKLRSDNWESDPAIIERTIPIFLALIEGDSTDHRNYAELGFVMKDKQNPDWEKAKENLTKAIELRKDWKKKGAWTTHYELVRAICEIQLDVKFADGVSSEKSICESILSDLKQAVRGKVLTPDNIEEMQGGLVTHWLQINQIDQKELFVGLLARA